MAKISGAEELTEDLIAMYDVLGTAVSLEQFADSRMPRLRSGEAHLRRLERCNKIPKD
jgi:hypothetical protein